MKKLDDILFNALSPNYEPDEELNHRIIDYEKENKMGEIKNIWRKSFPAAAAVAAAVMITSVTTFAAWRYLTAKDVAERVDDRKLAEAFTEEDAWNEAEVQSYGGYDISLIGLVSGTDISDYLSIQNGKVVADKTYAVVAISNADGTPMPDTSDAEYGKQDFLVSPYIEGCNPAIVNIFSLAGGGYSAFVEDGIQYRIMEAENIEVFADHTIYLGVTDGTFYNQDAYVFDAGSGRITRNDSYDGVNALFILPIDPSKADKDKAEKILSDIFAPSDENASDDPYQFATDDVREFMSKLTADNIDLYAEPVESTRQTLTPNERGEYSYSYEMPDGAAGSGTTAVSHVFAPGETGMSGNFGWSSSENGLEDLQIETHTLNEDGTVTFVIYVPIKK